MELATRPNADGQSVLLVSGEIDLQVADELRDAGLTAAARGEAIDLSQVTFIDSSGLAALIAINNEVQDLGRQLTLAALSTPVRRILEVTGLNDIFTIVD